MLFMCSPNGNTHNQFLNKHGLADTSTTEETNLSTTGIGSQEVDDLDTGDQDFRRCSLFDKLGRVGVDGRSLGGLDRPSLVDGVSGNVHDTTQSARADRNSDGGAGINSFVSSDKALGTWNARSVSRRDCMVKSSHPYRPRQYIAQRSPPNVAIDHQHFRVS